MKLREGDEPAVVIPVESEANIQAWLKRTGGQGYAQSTHRHGERRFRGMQVIGRDGRRRRVWFDVTHLPDDQRAPAPCGLFGSLRALFSR